MQFKINFKAMSGDAVTLKKQQVGISLVERAIEETNPNTFDIDSLSGEIAEKFETDVLVSIDYETAKLSKHFNDVSAINVEVDDSYLNEFYEIELEETSPASWCFKQKLNKAKLLEAWKAKEFTLDLRD